MFRIIVLLCIASLGGPFLTFAGFKEKQKMQRLESTGITVPGMIDGGKSKKGRRSSSYQFDVSFETEASKVHQLTFDVTKEFFQSKVSGDQIVDPKVEVLYNPADPNEAIIVKGSTDSTMMFPGGIAVTLDGIIGMGFYLRSKSQPS